MTKTHFEQFEREPSLAAGTPAANVAISVNPIDAMPLPPAVDMVDLAEYERLSAVAALTDEQISNLGISGVAPILGKSYGELSKEGLFSARIAASEARDAVAKMDELRDQRARDEIAKANTAAWRKGLDEMRAERAAREAEAQQAAADAQAEAARQEAEQRAEEARIAAEVEQREANKRADEARKAAEIERADSAITTLSTADAEKLDVSEVAALAGVTFAEVFRKGKSAAISEALTKAKTAREALNEPVVAGKVGARKPKHVISRVHKTPKAKTSVVNELIEAPIVTEVSETPVVPVAEAQETTQDETAPETESFNVPDYILQRSEQRRAEIAQREAAVNEIMALPGIVDRIETLRKDIIEGFAIYKMPEDQRRFEQECWRKLNALNTVVKEEVLLSGKEGSQAEEILTSALRRIASMYSGIVDEAADLFVEQTTAEPDTVAPKPAAHAAEAAEPVEDDGADIPLETNWSGVAAAEISAAEETAAEADSPRGAYEQEVANAIQEIMGFDGVSTVLGRLKEIIEIHVQNGETLEDLDTIGGPAWFQLSKLRERLEGAALDRSMASGLDWGELETAANNHVDTVIHDYMVEAVEAKKRANANQTAGTAEPAKPQQATDEIAPFMDSAQAFPQLSEEELRERFDFVAQSAFNSRNLWELRQRLDQSIDRYGYGNVPVRIVIKEIESEIDRIAPEEAAKEGVEVEVLREKMHLLFASELTNLQVKYLSDETAAPATPQAAKDEIIPGSFDDTITAGEKPEATQETVGEFEEEYNNLQAKITAFEQAKASMPELKDISVKVYLLNSLEDLWSEYKASQGAGKSAAQMVRDFTASPAASAYFNHLHDLEEKAHPDLSSQEITDRVDDSLDMVLSK